MDTDVDLLARLRAGDEAAFVTLVGRYNGSLLRLARTYVPSDAVAEEAVQETWMGVVRGVDRFEGRSSFKTWLFRILINRARTAGVREPRSVALADDEPAVDPARFTSGGAWAEPLQPWEADADDRLVAATWSQTLGQALDDLPPRQRAIVVLRDVEGLPSDDVCDGARDHRGQPAGPLAPGPQPAALHARSRPGAEGAMMHLLRRRSDLVCQQVVELVTDYLEGALSRRRPPALRGTTCATAPTARPTSSRCA